MNNVLLHIAMLFLNNSKDCIVPRKKFGQQWKKNPCQVQLYQKIRLRQFLFYSPQAGDSSTEATSGPPSVYANAGLYGNIPVKKEPVKRRRTHSGSLGLGGGCPSTSESIVTNNPAALTTTSMACGGNTEHVLLGKSNSLATSATATTCQAVPKTHKRQTSFPASSLQPQPTTSNSTTAAELIGK